MPTTQDKEQSLLIADISQQFSQVLNLFLEKTSNITLEQKEDALRELSLKLNETLINLKNKEVEKELSKFKFKSFNSRINNLIKLLDSLIPIKPVSKEKKKNDEEDFDENYRNG